MLDCLEIGPPQGARASVIWMHGLGADATDFEPVVPLLGLPDVRFVFPNAPKRPVTINGGWVMPAWYDILTMERVPDRESAADIREAAGWIQELVDREIDRGISPHNIVLAGFSQGAAMALYAGLRMDRRLAGILVLSGYFVLESTLTEEAHQANAETPIFFGHGQIDEVVRMELGRHAHDTLTSHPRTWRVYPIPHSVSGPEIADVAVWLHTVLPR